jgi:chromosome segregation protein
MKLSRLELSGFKSFADSVDLPFGAGVTAVVGPNGCGKSNISDAVRWVLGEQRARLLRSARMDEVIFQGSVKRRPINIAEASLVFDNSDGVLPVAYHEVVITRRISRSGQSEYLLNQTPVRLRDIMDVLRGTGLGSDAGVVIEAQMIDRLLSDRTEERRSLFEEAAGIGLYRDRKDSTERRLERTRTDLQRLDDVISEVQTQVRSLARQRGKTERHRRYTEERFAIVLTLARRELAEFESRHVEIKERRETLRQELPAAREGLTQEEQRRQQRVQERAAAETHRTELERRLSQARIEIERLERDSSVAVERLHVATDRRAKALEERTQAEVRVEQLTRELEAAKEERSSAETAQSSVQTELDLRTATEQDARTKLQQQRAAVRELEESRQRIAESLRALVGEQTALTRDAEELQRQESEGGDRLAAVTGELETARSELNEARARAVEHEREEREAAAALEGARHSLAAAREHEAAVRIERREVEGRITQFSARRDVLADLERKREGFAPAVRALLRDVEQVGRGSVLGPLSDFLTIGPREAPLAERLLGDWLQAVLVRDEDAVDQIRRWHTTTRPGPLILLPVRPGPTDGRGREPDLPLDVATPAGPWVAALLHGHRATDEAGDVIRRANGAVFLAGPGTGGPLSRRAELDQLDRDLEQAGSRLQELSTAATDAAEAHTTAERTLDEATERVARARATVRESEGAADDAGRRVQRAEREHEETAQSVERVAERKARQQSRLQTVQEQLAKDETERECLADQLKAQQSALADLEAAQEA